MDERFSLRKVTFVWDSAKAETNEKKHGVSFSQAAEVFFDPFFRVEDATKEAQEARQAILGLTKDWNLMYVVYTEISDGLRIISARQATSQERKRYEDQ